jgi:hypothetical protein
MVMGFGMLHYRCALKDDATLLAALQIEAIETQDRKSAFAAPKRAIKLQDAQNKVVSAFDQDAAGLIVIYNQKPVGYILYYTEDNTMHIEEFYATRCKPENHDTKIKVGTEMFSALATLKEEVDYITVCSSDYGRPFYKKIGFEERICSGMHFMEMKKDNIDKLRSSPHSANLPSSVIKKMTA